MTDKTLKNIHKLDSLDEVDTVNIYTSVGIWMDSTRPTISGTNTKGFFNFDGKSDEIRESYFIIKNYEKSYRKTSSEMFREWKDGLISGPDYSKWVSAYLRVWNKVHETG